MELFVVDATDHFCDTRFGLNAEPSSASSVVAPNLLCMRQLYQFRFNRHFLEREHKTCSEPRYDNI